MYTKHMLRQRRCGFWGYVVVVSRGVGDNLSCWVVSQADIDEEEWLSLYELSDPRGLRDSKISKILLCCNLFAYHVFTIIFLLECFIKIIAMGFIIHKNAYLRDAWNWMDFMIVIVSTIGLAPNLDQSSLKALRTCRILRPLRSMSQLKSMRSLLETFFASIPGLLNVCIFMTFIFTIFAIISINFFIGAQYQFCRSTEEL